MKMHLRAVNLFFHSFFRFYFFFPPFIPMTFTIKPLPSTQSGVDFGVSISDLDLEKITGKHSPPHTFLLNMIVFFSTNALNIF